MESIALQIKEWKKKYKEIYKIEYDDEIAYLKKPTVTTIQKYKQEKEKDVYQALAILFKECVLEEKYYDDELILAVAKSLLQKLPQVTDTIISKETGEDEIRKSAALVRHFFNVNPYNLPIDEFYQLVAEALWIQEYKNKQMEVAFANVLVQTFANNNPF